MRFRLSSDVWGARLSRARPLLLALALLALLALLLVPLSTRAPGVSQTMTFELESSDPAGTLLHLRALLEDSGGLLSEADLENGFRGSRARVNASVPESAADVLFAAALSSFKVTSVEVTSRGAAERVLLAEAVAAADRRLQAARDALAEASSTASSPQLAHLVEMLAEAEASRQVVSGELSSADSGSSVTQVSFLVLTPRRFAFGPLLLASVLAAASAAAALLSVRFRRRGGRLAPPARV